MCQTNEFEEVWLPTGFNIATPTNEGAGTYPECSGYMVTVQQEEGKKKEKR